MKVLIDDGLSTIQQVGGIYNQGFNLWKHLQRFIDCESTNYEYVKKLPRVAKRLIYTAHVNLRPFFRDYDLIHYQNYYTPQFSGKAKTVTTIHDMGGMQCPNVYPAWYNPYFRRIVHQTIRRSDAVIVVSHSVKEQLLRFFPTVDESRANVCLNGLRSIFSQLQPSVDQLAPLRLEPYSYFLFVGNLDKRKNLRLLLTQFVKARKQSLISKDTKLVLVGQKAVGYGEFQNLISEEENIFPLGRLSDADLVVLYRYCKAFLFPSLHEGFGIPILEAMSQKSPILISDIPSSLELNRRHNNRCFVYEIGRDNSLVEMLAYLDKNHAAIVSQLDYGDLSMYSYDNVAQEHIKVYKRVLGL